MQPTNQLLGVQFRAGIRLVTNAVSHETLLISDFLSHHILLQVRCNYIDNNIIFYHALKLMFIIQRDGKHRQDHLGIYQGKVLLLLV
jgi:hypothetical protein